MRVCVCVCVASMLARMCRYTWAGLSELPKIPLSDFMGLRVERSSGKWVHPWEEKVRKPKLVAGCY